MAKQVVLLVCFLALSSASLLQPFDLADEAEKELEQLISIVRGEILAAHNDLEDSEREFQSYSNAVYDSGVIDIQQESETIDSQISTIVDLAISAGHDVSVCTNYRELVLQRLPSQYSTEMKECIDFVNVERGIVVAGATYYVDIIINKLYNLERQLQSCRGDILCISPLLTQIELYKISLVQDIEEEVQQAEQQLTTLKLSVDTCSDTNIAEYTSRANSILRDITACVNRILG